MKEDKNKDVILKPWFDRANRYDVIRIKTKEDDSEEEEEERPEGIEEK